MVSLTSTLWIGGRACPERGGRSAHRQITRRLLKEEELASLHDEARLARQVSVLRVFECVAERRGLPIELDREVYSNLLRRLRSWVQTPILQSTRRSSM